MIRARVTTAPHRAAAVALIELTADHGAEIDDGLERLTGRAVAVGTVALRDLLGVDRGLVFRVDARSALLAPHGGVGVVRALLAAFGVAGVQIADTPPNDERERLERALAAAASPLALDLLLDQPRRAAAGDAPVADDVARALDRLVVPPTVLILGAANIGKSSLLNALADRPVAAVANEPGTTRDHVGAAIDCAGLVVRWVDTPGLRAGAGEVESAARLAAIELVPSADLVLLATDASAAAPEPPEGVTDVLVVGLRRDLGQPRTPAAVEVRLDDPPTLRALVGQVRERLVPASALADPGLWRFPVPGWVGP